MHKEKWMFLQKSLGPA